MADCATCGRVEGVNCGPAMHACDKLHQEHQEARDRLDFLVFVGAINESLAGWFHAVMDGLVDAADVGLCAYWEADCDENHTAPGAGRGGRVRALSSAVVRSQDEDTNRTK